MSTIRDNGIQWRDALSEMIKKTDNTIEKKEAVEKKAEKHLLFTTFQLDIELFETQVLCSLPGVEDCGTLRETDRMLRLEQLLKDISVTTLYDSKGLVNNKKLSSVKILPVEVKQGVFHPKIVLYGIKTENSCELGIMVGSANLTRTGIGSNRETMFVMAGKIPGKLAQDIEHFLSELKKNYLKKFSKEDLDDIQFFIDEYKGKSESKYKGRSNIHFIGSGPNIKENDYGREYFLTKLKKCIAFICWSPYWPSDITCPAVIKVLKENTDLTGNDVSVWFVPAPNREYKYSLSKDFYNSFSDSQFIRFRKEKTNEQKRFRFSHAKLYRYELNDKTWLVIGSHNMTSAAWGNDSLTQPKNIEVSIHFKCEGDFSHFKDDQYLDNNNFEDLEEDFPESTESEEDESCLEPIVAPPMYVSFDWSKREYTIKLFSAIESHIEIDLPFLNPFNLNKDGKTRENSEYSFFVKDQALALTNMVYRVTIGDEEYQGVIVELNRTDRILNYESLNTFLNSFTGKIQSNEGEGGNGNGGGGSTRGPRIKKPIFGDTDNWYDFFDHIAQLKERLLAEKERGECQLAGELLRLFTREYKKIKEHKENDSALNLDLIRLWLLLQDIEGVAAPGLQLLQLKKIKIELTKTLDIDPHFELWVNECLMAQPPEVETQKGLESE